MFCIWEALHKDQPGEEDLASLGRGLVSVLAGAVVGWVAGTTIDTGLPSNYDLLPQTISVEMEKVNGGKRPVIIEIDPVRFEQTGWIRVAAR
jgi:outer membrane lipoprotein SlyB